MNAETASWFSLLLNRKIHVEAPTVPYDMSCDCRAFIDVEHAMSLREFAVYYARYNALTIGSGAFIMMMMSLK